MISENVPFSGNIYNWHLLLPLFGVSPPLTSQHCGVDLKWQVGRPFLSLLDSSLILSKYSLSLLGLLLNVRLSWTRHSVIFTVSWWAPAFIRCDVSLRNTLLYPLGPAHWSYLLLLIGQRRCLDWRASGEATSHWSESNPGILGINAILSRSMGEQQLFFQVCYSESYALKHGGWRYQCIRTHLIDRVYIKEGHRIRAFIPSPLEHILRRYQSWYLGSSFWRVPII